MTARILDGRAIAKVIVEEVREQIADLERAGSPQPSIAVVRVGDDPASVRYASQIQRACVGAGLGFQLVALAPNIVDADLAHALGQLNADPAVSGIILQFPLPRNLNSALAVEAIDPAKDIDGVNPLNVGRLVSATGRFFVPATPLGGLELLRRAEIPLAGAYAVVVGRSEIVGKPLALLLLRRHATVTICHSRTIDLARHTRQADILAVAAGRPALIVGDMVAPGATVLDFGMNVVEGAPVGDVDPATVGEVAGAITPVPGGTGPMTIAMLLVNALQAAKWQAPGR